MRGTFGSLLFFTGGLYGWPLRAAEGRVRKKHGNTHQLIIWKTET